MDFKHFVQNQVLSKNYYIAKAGYLGWYYIKTIRKNPLLIYQMGKVASTSVENSLKAMPIGTPIFHFHFLSEQAIRLDEQLYYEEENGVRRRLKTRYFPYHLFASYFIRRCIFDRNHLKNKKWKIITLIRDPIARNISGFFEGILFQIPDFYERMGSIAYEDLCKAFTEKYYHEFPLTWFDSELKPFFGIDVYSTQFPRNKGYEIYSSETADLLLLRVEDLSTSFTTAISEFLDIKGAALVPANVADQKEYNNIYRAFVERIALPDSYIDKMYSSRLVRHFYNAEEIRRFVSRWQH